MNDSSTPEQPGTAIFRDEYGPDGTKTAVRVTRADRWILVNREFVARLRDEGELEWQPLTVVRGRPDSVMYRFDRKFNEHSDLYERIDEPGESVPAKPLTDDRPVHPAHGPLCTIDGDGKCRSPHCGRCGGVADAQGFCPSCPREQGPHANGFARARLVKRIKGYRNPLGGDEALREITEFATRSAARVDELTEQLAKADERKQLLAEVLNEVLGSFTHQGHPGEPCLRTGWIGTRIVARWRRIAAGRPDYDELIERLAGVELTDWQREHLREVWEAYEAGQPYALTFGGRLLAGGDTAREALRQLVQLAERAEGSR